MNSAIASIVSHYAISAIGEYRDSSVVDVGLIHGTYRVQTTTGTYCLQRLHPKLASDGILEDYRTVTEYLYRAGFPAPRLIPTSQGTPAHTDEEGRRWRLTTWLPGENTSTIRSLHMVHSGARLIGRFHRLMSGLDYTFQSTHPLHDTKYHLNNLQNAVQNHQENPWLVKILPWVDAVQNKLPALLLPEDMPRCVVHGDPKISNLLFDHEDQAIALLDLDTCTRHSPLVDLGDAVRAWCCVSSGTDAPELDLARYQAMMEGYAQAGFRLDPYSLQWLPQAGLLITLELASRFLADVLQDSYFAWDATLFPSRPEHNLHRAQHMILFAQKLEHALPLQQDIVSRIFSNQP